jgi:ribosome-interacting GTPase 1
MPANLSPEYKKAEQAYRAATDSQERLSCLKEMLRTIPKHKGTEHLQADLKSRIKELTEDLAGPRKGGARTGPVHVVRREGAAQIALLGPPNSGKSSLHAALTGSKAEAAAYPHTTHEPMPGMCPYEDIAFQLVDLPPLSPDYVAPWLVNALQPADAALLVIDVADPASAEQLEFVVACLGEKKITLTDAWPARGAPPARDDHAALDPFRIYLPAALVANKIELAPDADDVAALLELVGLELPVLATSTVTRAGLDAVGAFLFRELAIVRVYTKSPGKPPEMDRPFTVRAGATVLDVARLVHKDIAGSLRYARAWGTGVFDGQQVGPEHTVADRDVIELHVH